MLRGPPATPASRAAQEQDEAEAFSMLIDCDRCAVRGPACGDCVVGVLLGIPAVPGEPARPPVGRPSGASALQLDAPEQRALDVLADQGLVPRLRLVADTPPAGARSDHEEGRRRDAG